MPKKDNEEIIKQIKELEQKEGLPAGYIAELLYQNGKEGYDAGKVMKETLKEVLDEDYIVTEKTFNMKKHEKHIKQREKDKKTNRQKAKQKGIKVWTEGEMREEYSRTGEDCNYMPLELVGKPSYFVSPTYDGQFTDREFIKVSDLKTTKVGEEK